MTIENHSALVGKKEIAAYARRSWATVVVWIDQKQFPARLIDGVWHSDKTLIDEWFRFYLKKPVKVS